MGVNSLLRIVAVGTIAGGMVMVSGSMQANAACKTHTHTAQGGSSALQYLASVSAKYAWKAKAEAHDGWAYDNWYKATGKRMGCTKSGPGATWVCVARAHPCN